MNAVLLLATLRGGFRRGEGGRGVDWVARHSSLATCEYKKVVNTLAEIKAKVLDRYLIVNLVYSLWAFLIFLG